MAKKAAVSIDDSGETDAPAATAAARRGGWPKGKPRRPGAVLQDVRAPAMAAGSEVRPPVRERKRKGGQLNDKYELPSEMMADFAARGMTPEWKRETAAGANDPSYDVFLREQGWEPVGAERYPSFVVDGYKGPIRRDGLVLMERPVELTHEAMDEDRAAAREAVRIKEEQLGEAPKGTLPRQRKDGSSTVLQLEKSYERGGLPIE